MSPTRKPPSAPPPPAPARTAGKAREPRGARHGDKLTQILTTAAELFAQHGYEATSLDMIAERLGVHKATLYHYVPGKEAILFLCQSRSFADLEEVEAFARDPRKPVLERLRFFMRHLAKAQHNVFGRCLVLVGPKPLAEAAGGEVRAFQRRLDTLVRDLLTEGMESGAIRRCDPALASALLFGALNWVPRWYRAEGRLSVDQIADGFFEMITCGIAVSSPARGTGRRGHRPGQAGATGRVAR